MKRLKWTVEIEVTENLVEDGLDLTDRKLHDILTRYYSHAYGHEIGAKVTTRPSDDEIAALQGYGNTALYLAERSRK